MKVSLVTMGGCSKIVDIKGMLPLSVKTEGFIDSVKMVRYFQIDDVNPQLYIEARNELHLPNGETIEFDGENLSVTQDDSRIGRVT